MLFVGGANPLHYPDRLRWLDRIYREAIAEVAWSSHEAVGARVAERMGVVSLAEWAPAPAQLSPRFPRLPVWRPTGPPADRFEPVDLADPDQVGYEQHDRSLAPIWNAPLLYATPWWLAAEAVPLARMFLSRGWQVGLPNSA